MERSTQGPQIDPIHSQQPITTPLEFVEDLFSDSLTDDERRTLASLEISNDVSAVKLAGLLTAMCRGR